MQRRGMSLLGVLAGVVVIGIAGALIMSYARQSQTPPVVQQPKEVRWLIAHKPSEVFLRAQQVFAETLARETSGSLILRVVSPQDLGLIGDDVPQDKAMDLLRNGSVEVSTLYTVALGYDRPAFWALNVPFLFDTYEQVENAFESDIPTKMFTTLDDSPVRALALTLSGGFRVIATKNTSIATTRDLAGKRIITSGGPMAEAALKALGATPISMATTTGAVTDLSGADGVETTYSRFASLGDSVKSLKVINDTNHSLFATALVVGSDFFSTLTPLEQEALKKAGAEAARVEREDSITLASTTRANLQTQGMTIVEVPQKVREAMRAMTASVEADFASTTDTAIVQGLRSAR